MMKSVDESLREWPYAVSLPTQRRQWRMEEIRRIAMKRSSVRIIRHRVDSRHRTHQNRWKFRKFPVQTGATVDRDIKLPRTVTFQKCKHALAMTAIVADKMAGLTIMTDWKRPVQSEKYRGQSKAPQKPMCENSVLSFGTKTKRRTSKPGMNSDKI